MFLSEPSSEMNLQTTSRGVCVWGGGDWKEKGRGRHGKNQESGWTQRAFFRFRTCTRTFSLSGLFPFLIFCLPEAVKWKGDKQSLYSVCSLGSCYLFTRKTGDSSCPCTAHYTPQEMFPGWWQCGQGRDWLSEWGNRQLALADWEIFPAERAAIWPLWLPWFILQGTNVHCHLATTPSLPPSFSLAFVSVLTELPTWTWKSFPALPSHPLTPRYLRSYKKLNLHLKRAVWLQCPACQLPFLVRTGKQSPGTRASNLFLPRFIEKACLCSKLASN